MQIYYDSIAAIEQQTTQLDNVACHHCQQTEQLVSHGFIRKKQLGADPRAVGKRVFCSNRHQHTGCGRTTQLYLDVTIRYLHYASTAVVAFVIALIAGAIIPDAYKAATGATTSRNAARWLNRLCAQLSVYRSLTHQPPLQNVSETISDMVSRCPRRSPRPPRLLTLMTTFKMLLQRFGEPLCAAYQHQLQRTLL